ncbi:protein kinase [Corynebacterium sp. 35RC1]|nr:protein kinase [Corynebacterium sp. 35RC1]
MAFLQSGDLLENRYRIEAPIARGGMSTVYRCTDTRLGRLVAAKVMDARYAGDAVFAQRFRREALSMANLTHPNIVGVYDFNAEGEHIFLIMELIHGGTLRELLAERGPLPPHAAAAVMRDILTGLAVAHRAGLVHRDIKPDNALINQDHLVKLTDFGLVRAASAAQATGHQIVGTVAYLSPEQVNGDEIGPASDVYSAGILLFELLTGKTPFAGDTELAHAYQRLHTPVPQPSSLTPGTPKLFDELVATATSLDTSERFANAGEFLNALEDVSQELGLPAYTIPIPQHAAASEHTAVVPLQDATMVTKHIAEATSAPTEVPAATSAPTPEPAPEPAPVAETTVQPQVVAPPAPVAPGGVGNAPVPAAPPPLPSPLLSPLLFRANP